MENTQEPVVVNSASNGVGGKIGIAIVVLVLLIGALYYFSNRDNTDDVRSGQTADDTASLNQELDTAASADIEADLKKMDEEFSQ